MWDSIGAGNGPEFAPVLKLEAIRMRAWSKILRVALVSLLSAVTAGCGGQSLSDPAESHNAQPAAGLEGSGGDTTEGIAGSGASPEADASGVAVSTPGTVTGVGSCSGGGSAAPCLIDGASPGTPMTCPSNQCNVLGSTGPEIAITDAWEGGASSAMLAGDQACMSGETAAWSSQTWGAMLTFNLGPEVDSTGDAGVPGLPAAIAAPVQLTGSGVDVQISLSSGQTPTVQQVLLVVFVAGADAGTWYADEYCTQLPAADGRLVYVPWTALTYQCWQPGNPALAGPPLTGVVGVQVSAVYESTVADTYNLCVDQLSIAP